VTVAKALTLVFAVAAPAEKAGSVSVSACPAMSVP
jgi:hypothetical protein